MKKEWLLLVSTVVVTAVIALGIVRWLAPGLLGISTDLQVVQVAKEVPPFFENIFRQEDFQAKEYLINDPITKVRAKPLFPVVSGMGPNDLLGFRNKGIPNKADIVVIGDSQTYGNDVPFEQNWPNQMKPFFTPKKAAIYSMAVGGWGGVQYLDMFDKAKVFQPKVVVVAYYTGNDPLESLQLAYHIKKWNFLQPGPMPSGEGYISTSFPPPKSEGRQVTFRDGVRAIFTPSLRYMANQDHPKVHMGYKIMASTAEHISKQARESSIQVIFTIIPTKELAHLRKVEQDGLKPTQDYLNLVRAEAKNIESLAESIKKLPGAIYVDIVRPLQTAALGPVNLYQQGHANGHPQAAGHAIIAKAVAEEVKGFLPEPIRGLVALQSEPQQYQMIVVTENGYWAFASNKLVIANGWDIRKAYPVQLQDIAGLPMLGTIGIAAPGQFGPAMLQ